MRSRVAKQRTYKNYLLGVLMITLTSNYVDRNALGLLLQSIKVDLSLSDTQLGLLSGIAFALFYSVMGIPIARWADRGNRVVIIASATALWSVAVASCGLAGNFIHLLLIRIGVGVGEAGFIPPAHSLMADVFARAERPKAVAIFKLGIPLSMVIGYVFAGWLNELYGWRLTFLLLALPGLALAPVVWFTLREPRREKSLAGVTTWSVPALVSHPQNGASSQTRPSLKEVCLTLWAITSFRHLTMAWSIVALFGTGIGKWQPAFFIRSFGLHTGELGSWLAVMAGGGGLLGTYLGGVLASRYAAHNERLQLEAMALAYGGFGILYVGVFLSTHLYLTFPLMALAFLGGSAANGPLFATIQTLVPEPMRAMSIAILLFIANLIGMGVGPLVVGVLSDALRPTFGDESLRYALVALCPGYLWCGWHFWRASKTVSRDLDAMGESTTGASWPEPGSKETIRIPSLRSSGDG